MTVKELIARLEEFPDDTHVAIPDSDMMGFIASEIRELDLDRCYLFEGHYYPHDPRYPQPVHRVVVLRT